MSQAGIDFPAEFQGFFGWHSPLELREEPPFFLSNMRFQQRGEFVESLKGHGGRRCYLANQIAEGLMFLAKLGDQLEGSQGALHRWKEKGLLGLKMAGELGRMELPDLLGHLLSPR